MIYGKNPSIADLQRKLEPSESNMKCIKSIYYKPPTKKDQSKPSFFFKSSGRRAEH